MAVTLEAYRRIGGIRPLPWLEDVALYDTLALHDARIRHSPLVRIITSGRPCGRTGFGFAVQLGMWAELGELKQPFLVESPDAIESKTSARRSLRRLWNHRDRRDAGAIADAVLVDHGWLLDELAEAATFGSLIEAATFGSLIQAIACEQARSGAWTDRWPLVEIQDAIQKLRARVSALRRSDSRLQPLKHVEPVELFATVGQVS